LLDRKTGDRIQSASSDAATTAIIRWWLRLRLEPFAIRIGISLDTNHRQDDDGCGFVRVTAEAHNATLVWEFDDSAHRPLSPAAGRSVRLPCAKRHRMD
jgi:hypothetical protein